MKRFRNYMLLALGLAAAVGALTLSGSVSSYAGPPTVDVNVLNWPTDPIPVEVTKKPAREIFRQSYLFGGGSDEEDFTNDSPKRLVIETISTQCWFTVANSWPEVFLRISAGAQTHFCFVPVTVAGMGGFGVEVQQGTLEVKFYVEPGETVTVRAKEQPAGTTANGRVSLFGYYEEVPTP